MKQLVLIENSDIQAIKNGERLVINVEGTEFLLGYLGVMRNGMVDIRVDDEPSRTSHGHAKKQCPHCQRWIGANNWARHQTVHKGEATIYKQHKKPCQVCGKIMGGSGMWQHMKKLHPEQYKQYQKDQKERANG